MGSVTRLAAVVLFLSAPRAAGLGAQTCANAANPGDEAIWAARSHLTQRWFRDQFAEFFNLQKDHWDQSWGWAKYNDPGADRYEFGKMMSAGELLSSGIDGAVHEQGAWSARQYSLFAPVDVGRQVTALSRDPNALDLLYRDNVGRLRHRVLSGNPWNAGDLPPLSAEAIVSDLLATPKDDFRFDGELAAVSVAADRIDVFARRANALLHFAYVDGTGWSASVLTTSFVRTIPIGNIQRYFIASRPVVARRGASDIEVFAIDAFRHLIRYWRDGGVWSAEDVTQRAPGDVRIGSGDPVPFIRGSDISVFGRSSTGRLLRFHRSASAGWAAENVSDLAGSSVAVTGVPSVIAPDQTSIMLFVRGDFRFLSYILIPGFDWIEFDLTPETGAIAGDPVAVSRELNSFDAFARGINDNLLHYYWGDEGFAFEDLSLRPDYQRTGRSVAGPLTVGAQGADRLDVFAPSWVAGQLTHYYWSPRAGWHDEDLLESPNVIPTSDQVTGTTALAFRGSSALHAFTKRLTGTQTVVHFTAVVGRALDPWHRSPEYEPVAAGSARGYRHEPENDDDAFASSIRGALIPDRVEMKCPVFDAGPEQRASTMLHEAMHMIFWRWRHQPNNPGSDCSEDCSDDWFPHGVGDPGGAIEVHSGGTKNHSMNQIQIEFLCDLAEFPASWVPLEAIVSARSIANNRMSNRVLNPPGWSCGVPRPIG